MKHRAAGLLFVLSTLLMSGCHFWPEHLESLGESISGQVSGEAIAWRVGGDVVVVLIEHTDLFHSDDLMGHVVLEDIDDNIP